MGQVRHSPRSAAVLRAGGRGAVAAMAMSGLRQLTRSLDVVEKTPPERVLERTAPGLFRRAPVQRRPALVELVHWAYGAAGGAVFGGLPRRWRRLPGAGPLYGLLLWTGFEAGIAPALGLSPRPRRRVSEALSLLADHLLYGAVVGSGNRSRD